MCSVYHNWFLECDYFVDANLKLYFLRSPHYNNHKWYHAKPGEEFFLHSSNRETNTYHNIEEFIADHFEDFL